jgi:predicted RNA-binding Zn ribbon-like protein
VSRPRKLVSIEATPFVAGSLCLDLVNTTGARATGAPRERLLTYHDLLVLSERAGILDSRAARRLRRAAGDREADATRAFARVRQAREELYQLFVGIAERHQVDPKRVAGLSRLWRAARSRQELVVREEGVELRLVANGADLDDMLWPIVLSAVELLTSDRLHLLRRCAECDWLFLDESKNGSRRWCKSTCGNRARSRERYKRSRTADPAPIGSGSRRSRPSTPVS